MNADVTDRTCATYPRLPCWCRGAFVPCVSTCTRRRNRLRALAVARAVPKGEVRP